MAHNVDWDEIGLTFSSGRARAQRSLLDLCFSQPSAFFLVCLCSCRVFGGQVTSGISTIQ
eukprot:362718-Amphidinium_carterae.1